MAPILRSISDLNRSLRKLVPRAKIEVSRGASTGEFCIPVSVANKLHTRQNFRTPTLRVGVDLDNYEEQIKTGKCNHISLGTVTEKQVLDWDWWERKCPNCFSIATNLSRVIRSQPLIRNARRTLFDLDYLGVNLYAISSRSAAFLYPTTLVQLAEHGLLNTFADIYLTNNKQGVAARLGLDYMIDDSPKVIESMKYSGSTETILMSYTYNKSWKNLADYSVTSWAAIHDMLATEVAVRQAITLRKAPPDPDEIPF